MIQVNLSLKEIYAKLCPKCKKMLERMLAEKLAEQSVKQALEGKET